jgi:hypothetical protein
MASIAFIAFPAKIGTIIINGYTPVNFIDAKCMAGYYVIVSRCSGVIVRHYH